ncbi:MAG: hypothetical protein KDA85_09005, partial [Planctomycetaceae bacterium]|nr:hypothetical protein [Planctomycetaceae bacterium]
MIPPILRRFTYSCGRLSGSQGQRPADDRIQSDSRQGIWTIAAFLMIAVVLHTDFVTAADPSGPEITSPSQPAYRVPVDAVVIGDQLFVANSRSETVSRIDIPTRRVAQEWKATAPAALVRLGNDLLFLSQGHALYRFRLNGDSVTIADRVSVPAFPVELSVSDDASTIAVSSLWSRRVAIIEAADDKTTPADHSAVNGNSSLRMRHQVDLEFAPRCLQFLPNGMLVVADSFGGWMAVINPADGMVVTQRHLSAHNIRGLALAHDQLSLLISHQALSDEVFTSYERVFWGTVMQNGLQSMPIEQLLAEVGSTPDQEEDSSY